MNAVTTGTKNWSALLDLKFISGEEKTRLVPVKRYGPLSVQRAFYPEKALCHTYLLHPPGGVVGGDQLDLMIQSEPGSRALVTTPGATKFYQSAEHTARVSQQLNLEESATLEFLPQENIYFPGALVNAKTEVTMHADASLLLWEKHCFGRPANEESFDSGKITARLDIVKDKTLLLTETQRIDHAEILRSSGLRGNAVMGSFVVVSTALNKALLETCRALKCTNGITGITQPLESLLLIRYMGSSTLELNAYFVKLWEILRLQVLHRNACHPRIWNT
jgi:urease accessory protein